MTSSIKAIIFDMDNTLLQSSIDFKAMKQAIYAFLVSEGVLPAQLDLDRHTSSTIIKEAVQTKLMTEQQLSQMWDIAEQFEVIGMKQADLEPGVLELLEELQGRYRMVIVTNNSNKAAQAALKDHNILHYFDHVVGRESMGSLKPSPDAFHYVLRQHQELLPEAWVSVGDAWIDGAASIAVGIPFIAYRADRNKMKQHHVLPKAFIEDIRELKQYIG